MNTRILLVAACALLCGCGGVRKALTPSLKTSAAPRADLAGAKPTPGLDWTFTAAGANAALTYGAAGGAPQLMMACAQKSGSVVIGAPASESKAPATPTLTLISGTVRTSAAAAVQPWPADPSLSVLSARFSSLDPILQAFARNGAIGLPGKDDKPDMFVAQPNSSAIAQFQTFCG